MDDQKEAQERNSSKASKQEDVAENKGKQLSTLEEAGIRPKVEKKLKRHPLGGKGL